MCPQYNSAANIESVNSPSISFKFRTLEDVQIISEQVSNLCPHPSQAILGIIEMMLNAVEHGNLGIEYFEKTKLMFENNWHKEIEKRLKMPQNLDKFATISLDKTKTQTIITIKDQGNGFDWKNYLDISPERMADPNGKGIAISRMSFNEIKYNDCGNEVVCFIG